MADQFNPRGAPVPATGYYDDWELTNRPAMFPFLAEYTNALGEKSGGWAMPSMVTEPVNALSRLLDTPAGTMPDPRNEQNQRDALTGLMALYGGNAVGGMARNALGKSAARGLEMGAGRMGMMDYGKSAYLTARHPFERTTADLSDPMAIWDKFHFSPKEGGDLKNLPYWTESDGRIFTNYPVHGEDTFAGLSGPSRLSNDRGVHGDVEAYRSRPALFDIIDGGVLYGDEASTPVAYSNSIDASMSHPDMLRMMADIKYADLNRRALDEYGIGYEGLTSSQEAALRGWSDPSKF